MSFSDDLRAGRPLFGPFFKTPSPILAEVFGGIGFDCVCVDAEHGALDRGDLDLLLLAFRSTGTPVIVRPQNGSSEQILNALDCGANAVMIPHINSGEDAQRIADAATYFQGRGFAGSIRASGYGTVPMAEHIANANRDRIVIAQIEDAAALDHVDDIVSTDGVDCIFIGRSDLTVSMGLTDRDAPEVLDAVEMIARKSVEAGKTVGTFTTNLDELPKWREQGISLFLLGSEFGMLKAGAKAYKDAVQGQLE